MIAVQKDLNIEPKHKDGPILNQEAENTKKKLWDKNAHADVRCLMSGLRRQAGSDTRSASSSPPPLPLRASIAQKCANIATVAQAG